MASAWWTPTNCAAARSTRPAGAGGNSSRVRPPSPGSRRHLATRRTGAHRFRLRTDRKKLEAILHPRIRAGWRAQLETWRKEDCALALVVIPLLFETGAESHFEKIICCACSAAAQHERLTARGWNVEQGRQRIAAQLPVAQKIVRSHFVLWTEGSLASHARQVELVCAGSDGFFTGDKF